MGCCRWNCSKASQGTTISLNGIQLNSSGGSQGITISLNAIELNSSVVSLLLMQPKFITTILRVKNNQNNGLLLVELLQNVPRHNNQFATQSN